VRETCVGRVTIVLVECFQASPARPSDTETIKMKMVLFCAFFFTQLFVSSGQCGVQASCAVMKIEL
jgi:hypothetical protein